MRARPVRFVVVVLATVLFGAFFLRAEERSDSLGMILSGVLVLAGVVVLVRLLRDRPTPELTLDLLRRMTTRFAVVAAGSALTAVGCAIYARSAEPSVVPVAWTMAGALLLLAGAAALASVKTARMVTRGEIPADLRELWAQRRSGG